jgi:hypothetical protein
MRSEPSDKADKLVAADDIVDRSERPAVGARKHLAQDRVGRIGAIGRRFSRQAQLLIIRRLPR